jgi:hypothetical protein
MFKPSSREIQLRSKPQRCYLLMYKITMLAVMVGICRDVDSRTE